jgi:plasmid stabilization system protein ParE
MEITWTSHALGDLARLYEFLAPVNPLAAASVFERLTAGPDVLLTQPRIGTPLPDFLPRDVRYLLVGDYEIRYELTEKVIWILRLWHTREDR